MKLSVKMHKDFELLAANVRDKVLSAMDTVADGISCDTTVTIGNFVCRVRKVTFPGSEGESAVVTLTNEVDNICRLYELPLSQ